MGSKTKPKYSKRLIKKLFSEPELAVEKINLVYTTERQLSIERVKIKKSFQYRKKNIIIEEPELIERIKGLVIPPAWQKVRISHLDNSHLQATGRDEKSRKQYRYHPVWNKIRNQTKFYRMSEFGLVLPKLREGVEKDLRQRNWSKTKVLALVVKLLEETHIRIGNQQYAKRNKTYGLSTLRKRHVNLNGNKIRFEFIGKKGKEHKITLRNKKLVRLINKSQEIPGWELFKYYDEAGERRSIDSSMINSYIQELAGSTFTAKDFRTWAATIIFFETLMELGPADDLSIQKKNVLSAFDVAAKSLGNTRNVTRNYYVHPAVVSSYYNSKMFKVYNRVEKADKHIPNFTLSEQAVLKLIKDFDPFQLEEDNL